MDMDTQTAIENERRLEVQQRELAGMLVRVRENEREAAKHRAENERAKAVFEQGVENSRIVGNEAEIAEDRARIENALSKATDAHEGSLATVVRVSGELRAVQDALVVAWANTKRALAPDENAALDDAVEAMRTATEKLARAQEGTQRARQAVVDSEEIYAADDSARAWEQVLEARQASEQAVVREVHAERDVARANQSLAAAQQAIKNAELGVARDQLKSVSSAVDDTVVSLVRDYVAAQRTASELQRLLLERQSLSSRVSGQPVNDHFGDAGFATALLRAALAVQIGLESSGVRTTMDGALFGRFVQHRSDCLADEIRIAGEIATIALQPTDSN